MKVLLRLALFLPLALVSAQDNGHPAFCKAQPMTNSVSLPMLDSIIARQQGLIPDPSVRTGIIEAGLLLSGIRQVLTHVEIPTAKADQYKSYRDQVVSGLMPVLDAGMSSTLDAFSVGAEFLRL